MVQLEQNPTSRISHNGVVEVSVPAPPPHPPGSSWLLVYLGAWFPRRIQEAPRRTQKNTGRPRKDSG